MNKGKSRDIHFISADIIALGSIININYSSRRVFCDIRLQYRTANKKPRFNNTLKR